MKRTALALMMLMGLASTAEAGSLELNVSLRSDYVPGVGKIVIRELGEGEFTVYHDPNICTANGRMCTRIASHSMTVRAELVEDRRPVDGALLMRLTENIQLEVGSGFNATETVNYTAVVKVRDREVRVPLTVHAEAILKEEPVPLNP